MAYAKPNAMLAAPQIDQPRAHHRRRWTPLRLRQFDRASSHDGRTHEQVQTIPSL
jgi:hypothetical protein